ncbi:MAG: pilin [Candidatus Paceibacterota bacterium]|jgi:hypothetical protein
MNKRIFLFISLALIFCVIVPLSLVAADPSTGIIENPIGSDTFKELVELIINWIINIALVLAPLIIVYGGFVYMTATGDTNKISQGKNIILYAVIGFIVALLAKSLAGILTGLVVK